VTYFRHGQPGVLQRFRDGDRVVLQDVYRHYADAVAQAVVVALRRFSAEHAFDRRRAAADVPDLVQEVFIRAFGRESRRRFDGDRLYAPYLSQITRNVVVDFLRRHRRTRHAEREQSLEMLTIDLTVQGESDAFADWATNAVVDRYLALLPPELRQVHEIIYVRGLSQREAAAAMRVGRQVVRTLDLRLRDGLRAALAQSGVDPDAFKPPARAIHS
jgi:RNA polymerase sigma factor (sigma-70 family)